LSSIKRAYCRIKNYWAPLANSQRSLFLLLGSIGVLFSIVSSPLQAQNVVELLRFESAERSIYEQEPVQRLIQARLTVDGLTMVCDTAYRYLDRSELLAIGNLQIETEDAIIWTDSLRYFSKNERSLLRGRVIIEQENTRLFGTSVDYNFEEKIAYFTNGIRLEDSTGVLTARQGTYFEVQDSALFIEHVQLLTEDEYAESDFMTLARITKRSYLSGNVLIDNLSEQQRIRADSIYADSTGFRQLMGNAIIRTIDSAANDSQDDPTPEINTPDINTLDNPTPEINTDAEFDTTFVFAPSILVYDRDSTFTFKSDSLSQSWSTNFSTRSDSLRYDSEIEQFTLTGQPIAWYDNTELNAQTIIAQTDSNELSLLYLLNKAFVTVRAEKSGRFNQLKADTVITRFLDGRIQTMTLEPNVTILYFTQNEEDENDGAIELNTPLANIWFVEDDIDELAATASQGFVFEEDSSLSFRRLEGFRWSPDVRPRKPSINFEYRFDAVPNQPPFVFPLRFQQYVNDKKSVNFNPK
jgi:lipopolysaccharide export system protein LptA